MGCILVSIPHWSDLSLPSYSERFEARVEFQSHIGPI